MLSHLRFHRRAPSNPTSPLPDPPPSWEAAALQDRNSNPDDALLRPDTRPKSSNSASVPPMLPPINRVTSDFDPPFDHIRGDDRPASQDSRQAPSRPAQEESRSSFFSSATLQNFRRGGQGEHRQESAGNMPRQGQLPDNLLSRSKPPPPPINTGFSLRPAPVTKQPRTPTSFVTPTDLQHEQQGPLSGKRPTGTRFASEPAALPSVAPAAAETQKGKKGLPFLKNPMSTLLMRKRGGQNASATQPLPSAAEPGYAGIRGTRVHDFSAPRPKRAPTTAGPGGISAPKDRSSDPERTESRDGLVLEPGARESKSDQARPIPVDKDLPEKPVPPVPPKDGSVASHRTSSSLTSRACSTGASAVLGSASSVRTTASRNFSMSSSSRRDSTLSALPRHMKSTSSRFSFDMIGAANQEKLLEERHRQREQEKKTTDVGSNVQRDSRFDDFDDENFDYDAMMDDDGLEEAIPGVNADYEEDDGFGDAGFGDAGGFGEDDGLDGPVDPDNDQENFSGFVFQRSNPTSSIATPRTPGTGMLVTPRDTEGKAIGFALTKDTTPEIPFTASPIDVPHPTYPPKLDGESGLGIEGLSITSGQQAVRRDDDLYFDGGLADELDFEHDGVAFDESIFDNDDTDQYGRPIPGAFAQAKEAMQAALQQQLKHDTDVGALGATSVPTAHASGNAGLHQTSTDADGPGDSASPNTAVPEPLPTIPGQDLAYQAALAEAAQKAAALGKFRRSSSPPLPAELTITSPTDSHASNHHADLDASLDDYEDDPYSEDINDFEFEDDAIIAEANASALANDSDGFYGQEFGFYSAPLPTHQGYHSASSSNGSNALNAENLFQYANGGFFGPAGQGLARTTSGRAVSREPNLTPITERSEYSNRNSVMSLTLPPAIGNDGRSSAAGMHSPGLAQLAMLGSDDENMSLSALRKLRNKAWGGSQASLSSREGSPRSERALGPNGDPASSPWNAGPSHLGPAAHGHGRKGSAFSVWSNSDAGESGAGSPTMMVAPLVFPMSPPAPVPSILPQILSPASQTSAPPSVAPGLACSPVLEGSEDSDWHEQRGIDESFSESQAHDQDIGPPTSPEPTTPAQHRRSAMGHRHKGSADSISYTKEEEPESGGTRWVLERRRTAESGEIEILGREVVEGGRI
ncbi:hypothetical protein QBC34DRAFT_391757 [Podospora aff. communis PSN243]|uniref:AGC-kinase C-terminal domain-containing protein n=1 Tax=Podospora aff. communis PSN243 TaxID=3040156 RepID=A0AAV9H5M1_9PEZI|nr:hypothetical protein QBC34DRAFT_391757 [Podospora aff. communis PSN243]